MGHSSIVDMAGWRSLLIQLGLVAVGALSVVTLFSLGGQLVVAPALLPVQWLLARHTDAWVAKSFAILGALLAFEVVFLVVALLLGDGGNAALSGTALGLVAAIAFFRTADRG